jgi:hypothetical protein
LLPSLVGTIFEVGEISPLHLLPLAYQAETGEWRQTNQPRKRRMRKATPRPIQQPNPVKPQ